MELGSKAGAGRVHIERRTLNLQFSGGQAGLRRNRKLGRTPSRDHHADVFRAESCPHQGVAGGLRARLRIAEGGSFGSRSRIAILRLADIIKWQDGASFTDANPIDNPILVDTNVQRNKEFVVQDGCRVKMPNGNQRQRARMHSLGNLRARSGDVSIMELRALPDSFFG